MSSILRVRLGTRASALAQWQARWVAARLEELGVEVEMVPITTSGDRQQRGPIGDIGAQGVFTKEIQRALLDGRIDLAVHSLKDLPTDEVAGLCLGAVPQRGPAGDVLVCRNHDSLDAMPRGSLLGTGSLRRRCQLLHARPDLRTKDIRGNVETRLRKLDRGDYDALVLAEAGLRRLGMATQITEVLPISIILPAVGQGALGLECRRDHHTLQATLQRINHPPTLAAVSSERAMLAALHGGCLAPVGAWGRVDGDTLTLTGRVLSSDGSKKIETTLAGPPHAAEDIGRRVAEDLIAQGAADLILDSRQSS